MGNRICFPNLNGIRFIAALMVIISHIELNKSYFNLDNNFQGVKHLGKLGVSLFFVLSGFLITYLLMVEKEKCLFISYKKFYMRRILRIWPLYYFVIILSLFVLPNFELFDIPQLKLDIAGENNFIKIILLFIFFLPNLLIGIKLIPFATQTWSIGTEEQFYLIWPLIIDKIKRIKWWLFFLVILYNLVLIIIDLSLFDKISYISVIRNFIYCFQLDCLAVGAIGAYAFREKKDLLELITNNYS